MTLQLCTMRAWCAAFALSAGLLMGATAALAQDEPTFTEAQVIEIATTGELANEFAGFEDWDAAAYEAETSYGIWRVQFWDGTGEDVGWIDVQPESGRVLSSELRLPVTDEQRVSAEPILKDFIAEHPRVLELVSRPNREDMWIDYDRWARRWSVYLDRGADSLYCTILVDDNNTLANMQLDMIYFEVLSYDEWFAAMESRATAVAFGQPEVGARLREVDGWQASAERTDSGQVWAVAFYDGDMQQIATATVDVEAQTVLEYGTS